MSAYYSKLIIQHHLEQMSQMLEKLAKTDSWLSDSTRDKLKSLSVELNGITDSIDVDYNYNFCPPTEELFSRLRCYNKSIIKYF